MTNMSNKNKDPVLFILSVDTEEEWDWHGQFPEKNFSVTNTSNIPKFQAFCDNLGIKPTYFVDYAIANDINSVHNIKPHLKKGNCEVGGHLHPWCTPPIEEKVNENNNSHAINLPIDLVSRKLDNLCQKLETEFGVKPQSFRSGRWGTNGDMLKLLVSKGYTIDSSVHPYYADVSFSYHEAPDAPYWPDYQNCNNKGLQRDIFEIPVTSGYNRSNFPFWNKLHLALSKAPFRQFKLVGILWKLGLLRKIQLSPELADAENMIKLVKAALVDGHKVIHMYFHSSSLLPGMTPYVKNSADEKIFYDRIEAVFRFLNEHTKLQCCTLQEAAQLILEERHQCG